VNRIMAFLKETMEVFAEIWEELQEIILVLFERNKQKQGWNQKRNRLFGHKITAFFPGPHGAGLCQVWAEGVMNAI